MYADSSIKQKQLKKQLPLSGNLVGCLKSLLQITKWGAENIFLKLSLIMQLIVCSHVTLDCSGFKSLTIIKEKNNTYGC